jgi:hypothetical protein
MTENTSTPTPRKSIAMALDRAAERACLVARDGATAKQCWYLAGLIAAAGKDASDIGCAITQSNAVLTKREASEFIQMYLDDAARRAAA